MSGDDPLASVWAIHGIATDCFRIAQRAIANRPLHLERTVFRGMRRASVETRIALTRAELDALVVVSLWAIFERHLREYLRRKGRSVRTARPRVVARALHHHTEREMEYWRTDDVLDIFKGMVDPTLIGIAKQIKAYRDWVAHRNPRRPSPSKTDPTSAYTVLDQILQRMTTTERRARPSPRSRAR
jgi:hypothetical protein